MAGEEGWILAMHARHPAQRGPTLYVCVYMYMYLPAVDPPVTQGNNHSSHHESVGWITNDLEWSSMVVGFCVSYLKSWQREGQQY